VVRGSHPIVQDANDRNTVIRDAKVNHMPLDTTAVALTMWSQAEADFGDSANTWNAAVNKSV
jgi:hypothetical protein